MGFTQLQSSPLGDIESFVGMIPGKYKSDKHNNITGIDKVQLECACINGSFVNCVRESILYSFALCSPPEHKIKKRARNQTFQKCNLHCLSHITFYLEDDDHKPVDFEGETISFTCPSIEL